tara:strand:+ start:1756 stop:2928 length:1173 start_codon:yes stop_codon:yes gene_type:complete
MGIITEIKKHIFPTIVALSALSVSASAAFYSVSGLSKLFAGATLEVIIMASSLEFAKLVTASLLYQYWDKLNKLLKFYLTLSTIVLILITSAGIYGFLSSAYQETATKSEIVDRGIMVLELKKERFEENRLDYSQEKKQLDNGITDLRKGLTNNVIQYKDKETGVIITTTSSATRRALQSQLDMSIDRRDIISRKIESSLDSISALEVKILTIGSDSDISSELGPLKYLSELTGKPMNIIINILLLVIIFVFDPLAISLVIASNFAFNQINKKNKVELESDIDISKEAGKIERRLVDMEPKPLNPSKDFIKRLEKELSKTGYSINLHDTKEDVTEKTITVTDDLLENINKLKEESEETNEIIEPIVILPPNKRVLTYRRRDGDNPNKKTN